MLRNNFITHLLVWCILFIIGNIGIIAGAEKIESTRLLYKIFAGLFLFYSIWLLSISYHKKINENVLDKLSGTVAFKYRLFRWQCLAAFILCCAYSFIGTELDFRYLPEKDEQLRAYKAHYNNLSRTGFVLNCILVSYFATWNLQRKKRQSLRIY